MEQIVLTWAVPSCFLLLGLFFLFLRRLDLETSHWGAAFLLIGAGYTLTLFQLGQWSTVKPIVEDAFFLLGTNAMAGGTIRHFDAPRLLVARWTIIAATLALAAFSSGVMYSVRLETSVMQCGCAALLVAALWSARGRWRHAGDGVLYGAFAIVAAILGAQGFVFLALSEYGPVANAWQNSIWGFVFKITGAVIVLLLAFAILLAACMSVIERLRSASQVDALTGALNRRGFEETCRKLRMAAPRATPATLMFVDVDRFKEVNDAYGHQVGDAVLVALALALRTEAGARGCVGRLGGDEFAVLLLDMNPDAAKAAAEAVRTAFAGTWDALAAIDERALARAHDGPRPSVSIGLAALAPDQSLHAALAESDRRLYAAKRSGRNRIVLPA